ncbi:hypothetical protein Pth03_11850 [Planotetraspora thailandica]|uniref:Uncharacterized protein n=1 Tax=Planotetraspora thailandica TaxID=487172 RepID=A0A8J3UXQ5_9ACTN|nr:hypothetical protein Pth03_11850 [Planotetraspora thailandica]
MPETHPDDECRSKTEDWVSFAQVENISILGQDPKGIQFAPEVRKRLILHHDRIPPDGRAFGLGIRPASRGHTTRPRALTCHSIAWACRSN